MNKINRYFSKMVQKNHFIPISLMTISILVLLTITLSSIFLYRLNSKIYTLSTHIDSIEAKLASTTEELRGNIVKTNNNLSDALNKNVGDIEQKIGAYRQEVGSYSSTVNTLQKLSKTDPQLLAKYSKIFFLNENYAPARLVEISNQYAYSDRKTLKFLSQAWPYLQKMLDDAIKDSTEIYVFSSYRSFNEQKALKGQYSVIYGAGSANQFSADQGYSEHQLGTTIDLITKGLGGELEGFDRTKAYQWLVNNAYKYGFILSYPKDNKFYEFEPWHWRFVGIKLATDLHNQNKYFYDMDQRDIDEYLVNLFD